MSLFRLPGELYRDQTRIQTCEVTSSHTFNFLHMAILKKSIPLLIIPLLASCEEVFTPDVPYTPVLCMNSLITAGQPVETKISKSRLYTDNPDQSVVSDAEIRIYANGEAQPADYLPAEGIR